MRKLSLVALCLLLLMPLIASASHADEEGQRVKLSTRIFHVGALTLGQPHWIRVRATHEIDRPNDEETPLFGGESEEPFYPVGQVDELSELIRGFVAPAFWESTEGAFLSTLGDARLVARATKSVLTEVETFLSGLERRILTSVIVEVQAVRLAPQDVIEASPGSDVLDATMVDALVEKGGGPATTLTAYPGQRVSAFSGKQRAYVWDYWVSVAQGATFSDPVIGVANLGLMVEATPELGDDEQTLRLSLDAAMSQLEDARQIDTGEGRTVEVPVLDVFTCKTDLLLRTGTWRLVQGRANADESQWFLLVRATLRAHEGRPTPDVSAPIDPRPFADDGLLAPRLISVRMLSREMASVAGFGTHLLPSAYTPLEPPELPEPRPMVGAEDLPELILTTMGWASWEDPHSIEVRNGMLIVRNTAGRLRAVEDIVGRLRRQMLWSVETTAEVIVVPSALARRLATGSEGTLLSGADRKALDQAIEDGVAERVDTARVRNMGGVRNTVRSGREIAYVADYEGHIAQEASIANPVIHRVLSGLELDVDASLASTGDAVGLDVRFLRTRIRQPMRTMLTPHGNLDVPEMDVLRIRTSVMIPLGATALVGAGGDGDTQTILLLTPRLSRYGN